MACRAWLAVCLLAILVAPAGQACSLALRPDFTDAFATPGAVYANLGSTLARFPIEGGEARTVADAFFPGMPRFIVSPDGRYVVHEDQEGLGADCSGRRYTVLTDTTSGARTEWNASLRPLMATLDGFVAATQDPRRALFQPWNGTTRYYDWSFLPEEGFVDHWFSSAGSLDGKRLALWGGGRTGGVVYVMDVETGSRLAGPLALATANIRAMAMDSAGDRVAVMDFRYQETDEGGEAEVRVQVLDLQEANPRARTAWTMQVPRQNSWFHGSVVAWSDGWLAAGPDGAYVLPDAGAPHALDLVYEGTPMSSAASEHFVILLTTVNADAYTYTGHDIHVLARDLTPLATLRAGEAGWEVAQPVAGPTQTRTLDPPPNADAPGIGLAWTVLACLAGFLLLRRRQAS